MGWRENRNQPLWKSREIQTHIKTSTETISSVSAQGRTGPLEAACVVHFDLFFFPEQKPEMSELNMQTCLRALQTHLFREEYPHPINPSFSYMQEESHGEEKKLWIWGHQINSLSIWNIISFILRGMLICHSGFVFRGWQLRAINVRKSLIQSLFVHDLHRH